MDKVAELVPIDVTELNRNRRSGSSEGFTGQLHTVLLEVSPSESLVQLRFEIVQYVLVLASHLLIFLLKALVLTNANPNLP